MKKSYLSFSLLFCMLLAQVFVSVHDAKHIHDERYEIVHVAEDSSEHDSETSEQDCLVYALTQTLSHSSVQGDVLWSVGGVKDVYFFALDSDLFVSHSFSLYQSRAPPVLNV